MHDNLCSSGLVGFQYEILKKRRTTMKVSKVAEIWVGYHKINFLKGYPAATEQGKGESR